MGIGFLIFALGGSVVGKLNVQWPTEHPPVDMRNSFYALLQPTDSKKIQSGNFGCVRSEGARFHEGIDLKAFTRDARGEPTDLVRSVLAGTVVYTNKERSKSSYGRYVLIKHSDGEMTFMSLYAHLRAIEGGIVKGARVAAGQKIAIMGRSASYTIPQHRAHLHFEVCLRLTDSFQSWYDWKEYGDANVHGIYNGKNLVGIDPVTFFEETQWGDAETLRSVLEKQATAFTIVVSTKQVPDFVRRYPALVASVIPTDGLAGWRVDFTWYGVPKKWTPLIAKKGRKSNGKVALESYHPNLVVENSCRGMLRFRNGKPTIGPGLKSSIQLLFGYR